MASSAADKTVAVLDALSEHTRLADIAAAAGLPKATVHRILQAMVEQGFARSTGTGDYFSGPRLLSMAGRVLRHLDLPGQVRPHLAELHRGTGWTVHLALLSGDEAVYAVKIEADRPYRLTSRVGMSLQLHSTSIGKAILATMPDEQVVALALRTGLPGRTPRTITDVSGLLAELAEVRSRGWATDHEENELGVCAAGAAVVDHAGHVVGAISAATLAHEVGEFGDEVGRQVVRAAREVSRALGGPVDALPGGLSEV
jgi:IclR family transcriptional regulator, acetate operon repressor